VKKKYRVVIVVIIIIHSTMSSYPAAATSPSTTTTTSTSTSMSGADANSAATTYAAALAAASKANASPQSNTMTQDAAINTWMQQMTTSPLCDANCQYQRELAAKQQAYDTARSVRESAPEQEHMAYKDYMVFAKGEATFDEMQQKTLQADAAKSVRGYQTTFTEYESMIRSQIASYELLIQNVQHMRDWFREYQENNEELHETIHALQSDMVTNDRKTFYEQQEIQSIYDWYYNTLWWMFYALCVVYIFVTRNWINGILYILMPSITNRLVTWGYYAHAWLQNMGMLRHNVYLSEKASTSPAPTVTSL
jgi:hypothetical protein